MGALFLLVVALMALVGGLVGWWLETKHGAVLNAVAKRLTEGW